MKRNLLLIIILFLCGHPAGYAQERKTSLDVYYEQNFMLRKWFSDRRLNDPLTNGSSDLSFRLNYDLLKNIGFWGQMSIVFGHGSNMEASLNYVDMFGEYDPDDFYLMNLRKNAHINYVPTMRVAGGMLFSANIGKWKFRPYIGGGYENINTGQLCYDLKQKNTNKVYEVEYGWGGSNPTRFMAFVTAEMKISYTIYPKRDLLIGIVYRRYITEPEFSRIIKDYYREKDKNYLQKHVQKGNLINSLGFSLGINFK